MKIKRFIVSFVALLSLFSVCGRCHAQTGDLKITFKFKGEIPRAKPINAVVRGNVPVWDETLIVNKETKGIQNVVMYLHNHRSGTLLPVQPVPKHTILLEIKNRRFEPHVLLAQAGDKLLIRNSGPIGVNANVQGFVNQLNVQIPPNQSENIVLQPPARSFVVSSNIHPWMKSHILVVDHSFYGKSNEDGVLEIKDIPVGNKVVFKAWHETGTFKEGIIVDGKEEKWKKNTVEFDIEEGMNDIGVVEIPASNF